MSYCVNCGVELAESEKACPLCGVEVVNPKRPWKEPAIRPYPKRVERIVSKIDRRFVVSLASIFLIIPAAVAFLADFFGDGRLSWSIFVTGAMALVFFLVLFPFLYEHPRPYLYLAIDTAVLTAYIWLVNYAAAGTWFLPLGLPLVLIGCVYVSAFIYIVRRSRLAGLYKTSWIFLLTAAASVGVELAINLHNGSRPIFRWSPYVAVCCVIFAIMTAVLEKKQKIKEELLKRLFI